jgi:glycosyltransferase involved in cell wall biosynthesis
MDQSTPFVSVIIPAFGAAPWLGEALASLQAQSVANW